MSEPYRYRVTINLNGREVYWDITSNQALAVAQYVVQGLGPGKED